MEYRHRAGSLAEIAELNDSSELQWLHADKLSIFVPPADSKHAPRSHDSGGLKTHIQHVELIDSPAESLSVTDETASPMPHSPLGTSILPFSLLDPSFDRDQIITWASQLCHVKASQVLDIVPCTPLQEGLIALTTLRPGDYVTTNMFEIGEDIDTGKLQQAVDEVAASNPILRTRIASFPSEKGHVLLQVVIDEPVSWTSSCGQGHHSREGGGEDLMGLGTPLTRFTVVESLTDSSHHLLWQIHHALYDGWSLPLLLKEIEYAYFSQQSEGLLPMTTFIRYLLDQDDAERELFWKTYFDKARGIHFPSPKLDHHPQPDTEIILDVLDLAWGYSEFTPATIVKAAWAVAVANGAGSDEALFGLTVTGRQAPLSGIELVAGPTIATVPMRVTLEWDASLGELLDLVQDQTAEMIPFEQTGLQRISKMSDEAAVGCRFQSLLVVQPVDRGGEGDTDPPFLSEVVDATADKTVSTSDTYAIVVECQLDSDGVSLRIAFDSNVIGQKQMEFVVQNFEFALRQLSDSQRGKQSLRTLEDDLWDLHQVWAWNNEVPESTVDCIHNIIAQRATEKPSSPAVHAWDGDFTYSDLDNLSTRLALHLTDRNVAGKIIPLLFEKSKWAPIAAIAVMKAGGGCLALDSKQPQERLRSIMVQVDAPLVLSSISNEGLTHQLGAKMTITVGQDHQWPASTTSLPSVSPSDTLYLSFTSGSTGIPKGAIITHENFSSAITYQNKALGLSEASRVFDFSSYAFDAAWYNSILSFTCGGCLCIPSQEERQNDLAGSLEKYDANFVDLTPSVARVVGQKTLSRLSTLVLGGEAVLSSDAHLAGNQTKIINVYGPTECTPTATLAEILPNDITIGRGAGTCTWVIDPETQTPSRVGAVGELWLEGPLVGQGYLNNPEKTENSFIENPPWLLHGIPNRSGRVGQSGRRGRLYRTGDLVRYREDGSLIFIGRKDTQVKIRGQRVELGDIEQHILNALPANVSARVTAEIIQPNASSGVMLVAFVTLKNESSPITTEEDHNALVERVTEGLADHLATSIPIYMVPTAFIPIFDHPMTTTGKTDRKALQTIAESIHLQYRNTRSKEELEESLSPVEAILQKVWMSVLNLSAEEASIDKGFARLGGDSITAMQIVSQCKLHNLVFTVSDLLQTSTIRKLGAHCAVSSCTKPAAKEEQYTEEDELATTPFDLSPAQQMFFNAYPEGLNQWNQSFVLELSKPVSTSLLSDAMSALVRRHAMLRCRFQKNLETGRWTQHIADENDDRVFVFAEHFVERVQVLEVGQARQEALDIQQGPVFACDLFHISDGSQLLILSSHHLVVDLVSWRIIWGDIEDFVSHGKLLSEPTTPFRQWCRRQASAGANLSPLSVLPYSVPEEQLDFWGLPQSENTFSNCEAYDVRFDRETSAALFGDSNDSLRSEPIDIIIGALTHSFLHTFPERAPPVVWMEGHGREQSEELPFDIAATVGWFTTLNPRPIPITPGSPIVDAVRIAKDRRKQVPNKGHSYFMCRYHSESGRDAFRRHDISELTLNFSGQFQQLESEEGLFNRPEGLEGEFTEASPLARRFTMIEICAEVENNQLVVNFQVHKKMRHQKRLQEWTGNFSHTLTLAVNELLHLPSSLTLTDVPLLSLSYKGLDTLLKEQLPRTGIQPSNVVDVYPCSPLQEGIMLSAQKEAASYATFSVWQCLPTQGASAVSPSRLQSAWEAVVKRHTILQTVMAVHPEGNGFIQVVLAGSKVRVAQLNTDGENPGDVLACLERPSFAANEPEHAFTICQSTSTGDVACRLDASHSLIDASSLAVIVADIANSYDGNNLPSTRNSANGSHGNLSIPAAAIEGVAEFCRALNITRSVFIQVAWSMVLAQFTGKHDVCFGYLANGRDAPINNIEAMVGPLANLLISRVNLDVSPKEVLQRASQNSIQHLSIQHTSLAEIQHQLGLSDRLFNTALSIRGSDRPTENKEQSFTFHSHNGEDPHEFDLGLSANIDGDVMDVVMEFREPYITSDVAQDAATVLTKAIQYLLGTKIDELDDETVQGSLFDGFFEGLVGTTESSAKSFWQNQFSNLEGSHFPPLKIGTQSEVNNEVVLDLQGLEVLGRGDFSADTIVRAAWAILASRMTGSGEALFGATTVDGEVVPIRVSLDQQSGINKLLWEIQCQADSMTSFERTGLHRIRMMSEEAALACDFQTIVRVIDQSTKEPERHTSHSLAIECETGGNGAKLRLRFDSGVLGEQQALRIGHQLEHILHQLLDASLGERTLSSLPLASSQDFSEIWKWNYIVPRAVNACVHDLITQRARKQPSAQAICAWDGNLTYQQLDELSTNLARTLVKRGVRPGVVVPLFFEKSMWMPVAAVAVIKAGAAAVALDTVTQPEERLRSITRQVKAKLCLSSVTNKNLASRMGASALVVGPGRLRAAVAKQSLPTVTPNNLVYIVFTSGSTGTPKGVMINHRNMSSALAHQGKALGYRKSSRVLDFSSYAFDVFWSNLLNTLTTGACMCIASSEELQNDLSGTIEKYNVTLADLTPSLARHTMGLERLSTLVMGGEVVLPSDRELASEKAGVSSAYGPAECTPTSTILNLCKEMGGGLGRGAGVCTWIVDPDNENQLSPVGAPGELWLEGPLVGDGYFNDAEKTNKAFIQDPEWLVRGFPGQRPGRRGKLYRTGDIVQYKDDGSLLFIGRKDTQVKLRGQRVELGEVEHGVKVALQAQDKSLQHAQVVAEVIQSRDTGTKQLAAFVSFGGAALGDEHDVAVKRTTAGISERLAATVPAGKVDRRRLRNLGSQLTAKHLAELSRIDGERRAPRTDAERLIQGLWADVTKVDPHSISIDDNFFRIGGDSIGAMMLVGLARQNGLSSLTVRDIFRNPILRDLASLDIIQDDMKIRA
ncbi:Nonribosomal peptide synthase atnA [Cladobotryum mycophilum]|uniref:Nonribosomal peptide synthase atnA n=1 Tax=Cladobotryum mycophilum TaxID=491253 RepID=A0ABR0SAZ0_9HYPO